MFEHLYKAMTASDYKTDLLDLEKPEDLKGKKGKKGDGKKSGKNETTSKK